MKRRLVPAMLSLWLTLCLAVPGCAPGEEAGGGPLLPSLVLFTSHSEPVNNAVISRFEQETGIRVEVVAGSTGELLDRLEAGEEADVLWGGWREMLEPRRELFVPWDPQGLQSPGGEAVFVPVTWEGAVILVNENWMGPLPCEGWRDLLDPELRGRVAIGDPERSGGGRLALEGIALALGQEAEGYLVRLREQLREPESSDSAARACAEGEAAAAVISEELAGWYLRAGAPVRLAYPEEGSFFAAGTVQMVRGCRNGESARRFIAYLTDGDTQRFLGEELACRPVSPREEGALWLPSWQEIRVLEPGEGDGEDPLALWRRSGEEAAG